MGGLPGDRSRLHTTLKLSDPMYMLDVKMGRAGVKRNYVDIDRFMQEIGN